VLCAHDGSLFIAWKGVDNPALSVATVVLSGDAIIWPDGISARGLFLTGDNATPQLKHTTAVGVVDLPQCQQ